MNCAGRILQRTTFAVVSALLMAGCEPRCNNTGLPGAWQQDFDFQFGNGRSILQTSDGGYLIVGEGSPHGAPAPDLLKTDLSGEVMWVDFSRGPIYPDAAVELGDGSLVIVGFTREQKNVARLDVDGEVIWSGFLGDSVDAPPYLNELVSTSDGNLATISSSHYTLPRTVSVVKFDAEGAAIWTSDLQLAATDYVRGIVPTTSGGVTVLSGSFLRRLADDGTQLWSVTLSSDFHRKGRIAATDNDDVVLLGEDRISRFDADGNVVWNKVYDSAVGTEPIDFRATPDGGFIIGSSTRSNASTSTYFPRTSWYCQKMVLTTLDGNGAITREREYSTESIGFLDAIAPTSDGGYIILGSRGRGFFSSYSYLFLLKVDADG